MAQTRRTLPSASSALLNWSSAGSPAPRAQTAVTPQGPEGLHSIFPTRVWGSCGSRDVTEGADAQTLSPRPSATAKHTPGDPQLQEPLPTDTWSLPASVAILQFSTTSRLTLQSQESSAPPCFTQINSCYSGVCGPFPLRDDLSPQGIWYNQVPRNDKLSETERTLKVEVWRLCQCSILKRPRANLPRSLIKIDPLCSATVGK